MSLLVEWTVGGVSMETKVWVEVYGDCGLMLHPRPLPVRPGCVDEAVEELKKVFTARAIRVGMYEPVSRIEMPDGSSRQVMRFYYVTHTRSRNGYWVGTVDSRKLESASYIIPEGERDYGGAEATVAAALDNEAKSKN